MANRRMFSLKIIDTDIFNDMPQTARLLYYELAMRADDDGFVSSPKKIQRSSGCGDDDYKILIAKQFIIQFQSGVCVIKDWRIHNYIQKDRYQETQYLEEKSQLKEEENGSYTQCIQNVYKMDTQVRDRLESGKDRIGKESIELNKRECIKSPSQVAKEFFNNPEEQIKEFLLKGFEENILRREIGKFILYWTEPNRSGSKQRWEMEKTFEINRRLATWFSRIKSFNKDGSPDGMPKGIEI